MISVRWSMAVSWLVWFVAVAVFVSMVMLSVVCVRCRTKGPPVSIRQAASEIYIPSNTFRIIHPSQPTLHPSQSTHLLSPLSPLSDPGTQRRHRSVTPTETESLPSYENPPDVLGSDYMNDRDDYVEVLPEINPSLHHTAEPSSANHSRASTPSSDLIHDYENVPDPSKKDYLNVELLDYERSTPDRSVRSESNNDTEEEEEVEYENHIQERHEEESEDSDEEGNYVNQLPLTHSQPSA